MPGDRRGFVDRLLVSLLVSLLVAHVLALQLWPVGWFGDDLAYVRVASQRKEDSVWSLFARGDDASCRYRPLSKLLVRAAYRREELAGSIPRVASAASLVVGVALAYAWTRRLGIPRRYAWIGLAFFLVHQLPVAAVYRSGRMEQHFTVFGLLALLATEGYMESGAGRAGGWARLIAIPVALMTALLWSEGAAGFALLAPLAAIARRGTLGGGERVIHRRRAWAVIAMVALGVGAFAGLYTSAGALLGAGGRFQLRPGLPTVVNLLTAIAGWISPVSSVRVVRWLRDGPPDPAGLALAAGLSASLAWLLLRGLIITLRTRPALHSTVTLLGIAAVLVLIPVIFLQQLSEVYCYPSVLFFCLGAGILLGVQLDALRGEGGAGHLARALALALVAVCVSMHLLAGTEKISALRRNGQRFARLIEQVEGVAGAQPGSVVYLKPRTPEELPISQYVVPIRLVWALGPQRGYEVRWSVQGDAPPAGTPAWNVGEDGTITPVTE